jgi:NAD(P)-dependent dehydrogenase (short-subunit alcohol dehydrogenase family)
VWVTGAGSGIGRACAVAFAKAGARVALTGRRLSHLQQTASIIRELCSQSALVVQADVTDPEAVAAALRMIVETLGDPLVLVNSAGGNVTRRHRRNLSPAGERPGIGGNRVVGEVAGHDLLASEVIDQDLKGMFYCTLAVLPAMRSRGDGRIVHIASQAGVSLQTVTGPSYSASKHGVVAMSVSLNAEEGIHGIRSICISPGEVETPILDTRPSPPSAAEQSLMLQPDAALFCVSLPRRACATQVILLPTDDRQVRDRTRAIEAVVAD